MIWQFDQQFSQVISSGRHKPTPVSATGCCKMSTHITCLLQRLRDVLSGKHLAKVWSGSGKGKKALNTVGRWSSQYIGFSLQRWRYIERVNEDGLNSQEGCGAETASTHRRLWIVLCSYSILPFPAVHLNAAHSLALEPIESILVFHSGCIIVSLACCCENHFMLFPHLKRNKIQISDSLLLLRCSMLCVCTR